MSHADVFYMLSHDDFAERCLLTEAQYDALIGRGDWPAGVSAVDVILVPLGQFLALARVQEGEA